jgi:hypothetical protein
MKKAVALSILVVVIQLAAFVIAEAKQPTKVSQMGFVQARVAPPITTHEPLAHSFRQERRHLSYIEGQNIVVEQRYAEGIEVPLPFLVAELVQLKVDALIVPSLPVIRAANPATTIPIVMVTTPIRLRPGYLIAWRARNITWWNL